MGVRGLHIPRMTRRKKWILGTLGAVVLVLGITAFALREGRPLSRHPTKPAEIGTVVVGDDWMATLDEPGSIEFETVNSADWQTYRSGLINLKDPAAQRAGVEDGWEDISLFFHALRHPTRGLYIVDTGIEKAMVETPDTAIIHGAFLHWLLNLDRMKIHEPLGTWLAKQSTPLQGVFLTHLHSDHILGLRDVPKGTRLFAGQGESAVKDPSFYAEGPLTEQLFEGHAPLEELPFRHEDAGRFPGVIDVFGDGQLFAIAVPGHTKGSVAYVARTTTGPVLMTGDTSHTAWGWEHDVEPGSFTRDPPANREMLLRLRKLAAEHPGMQLRFGHQLPKPEKHAAP